jgi:hypothetical protein
MPIRMIAQELYRLIKEVERLEKKIKSIPLKNKLKSKISSAKQWC